jgi:hypothetical protein
MNFTWPFLYKFSSSKHQCWASPGSMLLGKGSEFGSAHKIQAFKEGENCKMRTKNWNITQITNKIKMERLYQGSLYHSIKYGDVPYLETKLSRPNLNLRPPASQAAGTLAKRYLDSLHILTILIRYNAVRFSLDLNKGLPSSSGSLEPSTKKPSLCKISTIKFLASVGYRVPAWLSLIREHCFIDY